MNDENEYILYGHLMEWGLRLAFVGTLLGILYVAKGF